MTDNHQSVRVEISALLVLKVFLVLLGLFLVYYLLDLILVILLSIVIASAIEPATRWFARYRVPRVLAVLTVYVLAFFVFAILIPVLVFPIVNDFSSLAVTIPARVNDVSFFTDPPEIFGAFFSNISLSDIVSAISGGLARVPQGVTGALVAIFGGFFQLVLLVVISFYLAVQPKGIESFIKLVAPIAQEDYVLDLWHRSQQKIGLWLQGQLLLGLIIGVLVFLGLAIFQVEHALLLAFLAAVFEIIPFFGPVLAAVPAVLIAFSNDVALGLIVIGFYIVIQQFENHLIYPLVVRKIVGVPPLLVIISLIVGAQLAGFIGLILAVPVATVLMELLADYEASRQLSRTHA